MEYSSLWQAFTSTGTRVPYRIAQCYLPPIVDITPSQLKLILDLVTPEGCQA